MRRSQQDSNDGQLRKASSSRLAPSATKPADKARGGHTRLGWIVSTAGTFTFALRLRYDAGVFREVRESDWSADHIARHGVTLDEVREAILEQPYWQQSGRDDTVECFGQTYAGRFLFVVATADDDPAVAFIVTAREMTPTERRLFEKKAQ